MAGWVTEELLVKRVPPLMLAVPQSLLTPKDKARAKWLSGLPSTLPGPHSSVALPTDGGLP
eukprot:7695406-Heterocapsa_arctica.AAC.1